MYGLTLSISFILVIKSHQQNRKKIFSNYSIEKKLLLFEIILNNIRGIVVFGLIIFVPEKDFNFLVYTDQIYDLSDTTIFIF